MSIMDQRSDAMQRAYALDEELRFKATARRNKMMGLWAAGHLGKAGAAADDYAREVVMADFEEVGDGDVIAKIARDFGTGSVGIDQAEIARQLAEFGVRAYEDIKAGR